MTSSNAAYSQSENANHSNQTANDGAHEVLQESVDGALRQIDMVIRRGVGDDLNLRAVNVAREMIIQLAGDISRCLDNEVASYNSLMDIVDERDLTITTLTRQLEALQAFKNNADAEIREAVEAVAKELDDLRAKYSRLVYDSEQAAQAHRVESEEYERLGKLAAVELRRVKAELTDYRKSYPASMKETISQQTAEIGKMRATRREESKLRMEIQASLSQANQKAIGYRRRISSLEVEVVELREQIQGSRSQLKEMAQILVRDAGREDEAVFISRTNDGHDVHCCINTFHFQCPMLLSTDFTERDCNYRINRHWQIRTTLMIDMTVVSSPWGRAIMTMLTPLKDHWNSEITADIERRIEQILEAECPQMYKRLIDGQNTPLEALKLNKRTQTMLSGHNFRSVRDVGSILTPEFETIKGAVRRWQKR